RHEHRKAAASGSDKAHNALEPFPVRLVEHARPVAIDVENGDERAAEVEYGNHDLRARTRIAGDMAGKLVHVRHGHGLALRSGRPAHALAEGNAQTAQRSLIGTDDKLVRFLRIDHVKAGPEIM